MACLYILTNKLNGKSYVGQTIRSFRYRMTQHLQKSKSSNTKINRALKKYGRENFDVFLFECSEERLDNFEIDFIQTLNSVKNGYNLESGGHVVKHHSNETIKKMKKSAHKGADHFLFGKHPSSDTIEKMKKNNAKSNNPFYGKRHTEENKQKNREAHLGKVDSEETRKKRSESAKLAWNIRKRGIIKR